jgi:activator of HSP90 ATPase
MEGFAKITEVSKFEGDATVNTRKGNKKFAVFDLTVTCKWEGQCKAFEVGWCRLTPS